MEKIKKKTTIQKAPKSNAAIINETLINKPGTK